MKRTAFFISDSTGITAEVMGESLLSHFPNITFERHTLPYIDTPERAQEAADKINQAAAADGLAPIIFDTLIDQSISDIVKKSEGFFIDVLDTFLAPLEKALDSPSSYNIGRPKIATENSHYNRRIAAIHFALDNDDGGKIHKYGEADIILVGVSRSGKTPTCLYLALQSGIFPANYPITEDDIENMRLPKAVQGYRDKLFGLTIQADRLRSIRNERMADSRYASAKQCELEIQEAEYMFQQNNIPYIDTTDFSIEEISTRILAETGIQRRFK